MKLAMFAILGLLLGIGGGSAMAVMQAKKGFASYDAERAKVVADSIEQAAGHGATGDSTHVAAAGADSAAHAPDSAHAAAPTAPTGAPAQPAGAAHGPPAAPVAAPTKEPSRDRAVATVESHGGTRPTGTPVPPRKPLATSESSSGITRIGKVLGAMPPKDAARVLEQLTDTDVHEILGQLPDKQAAGILQFLPPARAAAISKLALAAARGGHA